MRSHLKRLVLSGLLGTIAVTVALAGCGGDSGDESSKVTVFAAASLTEAFTELGEQFESENKGTEVDFSFAASSELAAQIESGAPADVFASADEPNMEKVVEAGLADGDPRAFAGNVLEIAVPKGNPGGITGLKELSKDELVVAICDLEVPCGNAASQVFDKAGVKPAVDSFEPDVKSVLTKVELGEVDAGLVYHSDVIASGDRIDSVVIPENVQVVNTYPIVLVKEAGNPEGGEQFIDLVLSAAGSAELERRGFRAP